MFLYCKSSRLFLIFFHFSKFVHILKNTQQFANYHIFKKQHFFRMKKNYMVFLKKICSFWKKKTSFFALLYNQLTKEMLDIFVVNDLIQFCYFLVENFQSNVNRFRLVADIEFQNFGSQFACRGFGRHLSCRQIDNFYSFFFSLFGRLPQCRRKIYLLWKVVFKFATNIGQQERSILQSRKIGVSNP